MIQLHEQIASDQYWVGPTVPPTEHIPFASQVWDVFRGDAVLIGIDRAAREIAERGANVSPIVSGEELAVDVPGALLKVVEDMRTYPERSTRGRRFDAPEIFNTQAQTMLDEALFTGSQTATRVDGADGIMHLARRTVYLQNSASQKQLAGKPNELLGKGGSQYSTVFMRREPVGHVRSFETRRDRVQTRIVSAEVITPSGPKRERKIIDLGAIGARLSPGAVPAGV